MSKSQKEFLNPYYFIPLPEKRVDRPKEKGEERLSGKIVYRLTTRTPLSIPNTSCDRAFSSELKEHKSYDFYSYRNLKQLEGEKGPREPIIPGSELRGMFRSVYEAITGSCMSSVNDDMVITNRIIPKQSFKPGLLKKDGDDIVLIPGKGTRIYWDKAGDFQDGDKVFFKKGEDKKGGKRTWELFAKEEDKTDSEGYLLKGLEAKDNRKRNAMIIEPDEEGKSPINYAFQDMKKGFEDVLRAYEKDYDSHKGKRGGQKPYQEYQAAYHRFLEGKGEMYFPVYYGEIQGKESMITVHLAPAHITKKGYRNRVGDLLKKGNFQPCQKRETRCQACDLFGMIGEDHRQAKASSIRFADARLDKDYADLKDVYYEKPVVLQELSSPKISNSYFYLKKPEGALEWNYDYKQTQAGNYELYDAQIQGRKFYWHWEPKQVILEDAPQIERNVTVRIVKEKVAFQGELYFGEITQTQLKQLIYLFDLGREEKQGYKLGMGKPLGLGSVATRIEKIVLRRFDLEAEEMYREDVIDMDNEDERMVYAGSYEEAGFLGGEVKKWFDLLTTFDTAKGTTISYPYTRDQASDTQIQEGFKWFVENRKKGGKKIQVLAPTTKELPFLKPLKVEDKRNQSGGTKGGSEKNGHGKPNR